MKAAKIVRLSNIIGSVAIVLLVYWVFIFLCIEVFGLKIFRQKMTETFFMSVLGILALMLGALMINVMYNLTRIAGKHNNDTATTDSNRTDKKNRRLMWVFLISLPVVFTMLYAGDNPTSRKKEKMLIASAKSIVENNKSKADKLASYSFTEQWIKETDDILDVLSGTDRHFPAVSVIVKDTIGESEVFLGFREYHNPSDTLPPQKKSYMGKTTKEERDYLHQIFNGNHKEIKYSAHDGNYQLFYPYQKNRKIIVLYFTDYQRYGKIGS